MSILEDESTLPALPDRAAPDPAEEAAEDGAEHFTPTIGLAMGAGIARGWAHIGVLRVLSEAGLMPDVISGTSVGALAGGALLAGRLDELEEWSRSLSRMRLLRYLDVKVRSSGLIGGKRLEAELDRYFDDLAIEDLPKPFIAVGADMVSGHEVWMRKGSLSQALRASFSLPGVFPPVRWDNRWVVDGALVNPVPTSALIAFGAHVSIAVNLSSDQLGRAMLTDEGIPRIAGYDLLSEALDGKDGLASIAKKALVRRVFRRQPKEPSLSGVMVSALGIVLDRIGRARLAADPPDVQIVPNVGHIGPLEFDRAAELIEAGAEATQRALPEIAAALDRAGRSRRRLLGAP